MEVEKWEIEQGKMEGKWEEKAMINLGKFREYMPSVVLRNRAILTRFRFRLRQLIFLGTISVSDSGSLRFLL